MSETIVQKKLNKLINQELGGLIVLNSPYISGGLLTISVVRITKDLSLAKVYISVLPESKMEDTITSLNENAWEIRFELGKRIRNKVRKIPELRFYADDSYKEAEKINKLLDQIKQEEEDTE